MNTILNHFLVGGISLHLIFSPVARAESDRDRVVRRNAESAVAELERDGWELRDEGGRPLGLSDLNANPFQKISLVSKSPDEARLEASVTRGAKGVSIRLVAYRGETALARRALSIKSGDDVEAAKLRFLQTLESFSSEVARKQGAVETSLLRTWIRNFASLFAVPEARASAGSVAGVFLSIVCGAIGLYMATASIALAWTDKPGTMVGSFVFAVGAMLFGSLSIAIYGETTARSSRRSLPRD